jgi:hypothetical protein
LKEVRSSVFRAEFKAALDAFLSFTQMGFGLAGACSIESRSREQTIS